MLLLHYISFVFLRIIAQCLKHASPCVQIFKVPWNLSDKKWTGDANARGAPCRHLWGEFPKARTTQRFAKEVLFTLVREQSEWCVRNTTTRATTTSTSVLLRYVMRTSSFLSVSTGLFFRSIARNGGNIVVIRMRRV